MSEENGQTLDDKSVLLVVEFHKLGNTRKVNPNQIKSTLTSQCCTSTKVCWIHQSMTRLKSMTVKLAHG